MRLYDFTEVHWKMAVKKEQKDVQVIKKKPRGGNSPVIGDNGLMLEKGDNAKIMSINIALFNMQDIDMTNAQAVTDRLGKYFALYEQADLKPTVAGMAIALNGMSRQTLTAIAHDRVTGSTGYKSALPPEVTATAVTEKKGNPIVTLKSIDKQLIGQVAAKIRSLRKPEPYKGKGIKFVGEQIRRKAGKSAGAK